MTGIQAQSYTTGLFGCSDKWCDGCFAVLCITRGIGLCVELYTVGATGLGTLHHPWVGIDKDTGTDAGSLEGLADVRQEGFVLQRVPSVVRRYLVVSVGYERHLRGYHFQYEFGERVDGIAFDVKLGGNLRSQVAYILIADVTFVRSWVYGNTLTAK